jgi:ribose/xylose/arabinose/galactoside ABC-type transport system permease subunit
MTMRKAVLRERLGGVGAVLVFAAIYAVLIVIFSSLNPRFATYGNAQAIMRHMSSNGLAALGLTFVVIVRQNDMAFPWVASFGGMTTGFLIASGYSVAIALAGGILASLLFGLANGIAIGIFELPDVITTIATGSIAFGLGYLYSDGVSIFDNFLTSGILQLNDYRIAGVQLPPILLLTAYIVAFVVLEYTRFGSGFYATGENRRSAYFSGIRVRGYVITAFCLSAALATFAAVLLSAGGGRADVRMGLLFLMPAYASVFLGTALFGRTSVAATLVGTLFMSTIINGFLVMGVPYYVGDAVLSAIIILALGSANALVREHLRNFSYAVSAVFDRDKQRIVR